MAARPGGRALLDTGWEALDLGALAHTTATRLVRLIHEYEAYTIEDVTLLPLSRTDARHVHDLLLDLAEAMLRTDEETRDPSADPPSGPLTPGMTEGGLLAWARAHEVDDLLSIPVERLLPPHLVPRSVYRFPMTLAEVITAPTPSFHPRHAFIPWSEEIQNAAIEALLHQATATQAAVQAEAHMEARRAVAPEHPGLRDTWAHLRARRAAARALGPQRGLTASGHQHLASDPPTIHARMEGPHRIVWQIRPETLAMSELPIEPPLALALLDRVIDLLTSDEDAPLRQRLAAHLDVPAWERALVALAQIAAAPVPDPDDDKNLLCWRLVPRNGRLDLEAVRARITKRGSFQTRLTPLHKVQDLLSDPVDALVHALLDSPSQRTRHGVLEALEHLVGHPRVLSSEGIPIPVRRARFELRVLIENGAARLVATLDGAPLTGSELEVAATHNLSTDRLAVLKDGVLRVARIRPGTLDRLRPWLARDARIPLTHADRLLDIVHVVSELAPVHVPPALRGTRLPGDRRPLLLLEWSAEGALSIEARVRPVVELAPSAPGEGSSTLFVHRGGTRYCVERDLDHEPALLRDALAVLDLPERAAQSTFTWRLDRLDASLAAVEKLQAHLSSFQVEWRGEVPRVRTPIVAKNLKLQVRASQDWFGLNGAVRLESGAVDFQALLRSLVEGHDYVQIGAGTFARLDKALRTQLTALSDGHDGPLSPLLAPVVQALEAAGAEVEAPVEWHTLLDRLDAARNLQAPVPGGLCATLRDYQLEGFRWLAALAHWAPGACLADDMGLGKTVQTIALLLRRAPQGPALVVAPASVVFNWERELERFAPDLAVRVHHGATRDTQLDLGPGTVLLTTYGVLVRDAEPLRGVRFATAVLDEAQAIKNAATQRAVAATQLDAAFRLALSGTPVENHVGELWSLFRFVAPGLLGTAQAFQGRFVDAANSPSARGALAAMVRPFVLRRTKEQVERELPALTESVLRVQLSGAERTLYESARIKAVARMQGVSNVERRMRVLQELLHLRQLACHPRLTDPGSDVPSSKLRQLRRLIEDLRANGHRALVFSQFVRHLALVREALDADGVRYRYLDGTTPLPLRRTEVDAFQSGDGDVFLISLGAGGVGLNLTAANYVVHLDPWWNPAKEDQATDRAHRIGQEQPVTVYRLVAEGTIEEQILALHAEKRELAEALLDGTDSASRASTEELLTLLAGSGGTGPRTASFPTPPATLES